MNKTGQLVRAADRRKIKKGRFFIMHKKHTIFSGEKTVAFIAILAVAVVIGIVIGRGIAEKPAWDVCYDMTNRNIEWTYAGRK